MRPVVITRPQPASGALAELVAEAGFEPIVFPTIAIGGAPDPEHLGAVLQRISAFRLVIFVSPNAIEGALTALPGSWPKHVPIGVMGPGSVAALAHYGIARPAFRIISPDQTPASATDPAPPAITEHAGEELRFDSESLYQKLDLAELRPGPVLVVKGNGGRTWLYDTLAAEGIAIEMVQSYARSLPRPSEPERAPMRRLIGANGAAQLIVTSSESIGNLIRLLESDLGITAGAWVRAQRLIVPHARIAENATALGFTNVVLSGPGDLNIVRALK